MNIAAMTDKAILEEMGSRIERMRLNQNMTQIALLQRAGVARNVVQQLESGHGCRLDNLVRVLRALGALDALDAFLPVPAISPLQLAKLQGRERQRAFGPRKKRVKV